MSRDLQPLIAGPHLQLGAYTGRFARSEPAQVYFDRAKRIGVTEPDVWYVAGKAAADRGDWGAALADWHEALARSPVRLAAIARRAAGHVAPERFREQALPDDPAVWFAVIPQLFGDNAAERVKWLRAIDERCSRREPETTFGFAAWASALDELDDASGAIRVGQRAISRFPDDEELHNRLAARLETEDRYEEAQSVLEWLIQHQPEQSNYRTRLAAVRHALDLKAQLNRR
jgi:tetratricopeptide (TPR) repeat protein